MTDYTAQMTPMLLLAGMATGWVAEALSRGRGYGFMHDLALGIVGSLIAGTAMSLLTAEGGGMVAMFIIGCAGGTLAIAAQRQFFRSARPPT